MTCVSLSTACDDADWLGLPPDDGWLNGRRVVDTCARCGQYDRYRTLWRYAVPLTVEQRAGRRAVWRTARAGDAWVCGACAVTLAAGRHE